MRRALAWCFGAPDGGLTKTGPGTLVLSVSVTVPDRIQVVNGGSAVKAAKLVVDNGMLYAVTTSSDTGWFCVRSALRRKQYESLNETIYRVKLGDYKNKE